MVDSMKQIFLLKPEVLTPNRNGFIAKKRKWHKAGSTVYIYLFYTSYSYNSISRYAYRGISAHIPRRDLVIFCVLRSHDYH